MNVGMLWFDNDSKADLVVKIERASAYYQKKYGKRPNLCFVHPSMAPGEGSPRGATETQNAPKVLKAGNVEVRTTRSVRPNHLWIGLNGGANSAATP
jgi:hypothetical protein